MDIAVAMLADLPFSAFAEEDQKLAAYIEEKSWSEELQAEIRALNGRFWVEYTAELMPDINWNEQWELHFDPVIIAPFCGIRATFHPPIENVLHEIVIQPEMAFGTGHHATTKMMIEGMSTFDFADKKVLDFGSGTAVLAILAAQMGARHVDAIEIEKPACESARSNIHRNKAGQVVEVIEGDIRVIPSKDYDILLANINRNVLLEDLPALDNLLCPTAFIGLSGFLKQDVQVMTQKAIKLGWSLTHDAQLGDWVALWFTKPNNK